MKKQSIQPTEKFSRDDLTTQIGLIKGQIQNIKNAGEDKPEEIKSLLKEMDKYKKLLKEVKK